MIRRANQYYEFGGYRVDPTERLLFKDGETVPLTPKVFDTLLVLVENAGHILSKDEMVARVWTDSIVEEANLTRNISVLRKALGENPDDNQYIETIPWRGYRFVADVRMVGDHGGELTFEEHTRSSIRIERENETKTGSSLFGRPAVAVLVVVFALIAAAIVYRLSTVERTEAPPTIASIAVLPLENLSGDPSQEYFADGMTEALINKLAQVGALRVISRTSVMSYKGASKPIPEIARELGVDAVMTGSVRRLDDKIRVTAQLIHGATDTHIWAREFEQDARRIQNLESEIAREVVNGIRVQLTTEESTRLAAARIVDPEAHEAYLLGRFYFSKSNEEDYKRAFELFERATKLAPDHARAHAGMSDALLQLGVFGVRPFGEAAHAARTAALKAIELDEQLPEAHVSLAILKYSYDWDWSGAEREFKRALELDPGNLMAHRHYGKLLMCLGRHDEAVREGYVALQLDPASSEAQTDVGRFLYRARRYEEAFPHLQRAVEMEPRSVDANVRLGDLLVHLGRNAEAIALFEKARDLTGDERFISFGVARVYAVMGKEREARQLVGQVKLPSIYAAMVYAAMGDKDEAFKILDRAVEERSTLLVTLKEDPLFENLHSDPRWQKLLTRMNFPS